MPNVQLAKAKQTLLCKHCGHAAETYTAPPLCYMPSLA